MSGSHAPRPKKNKDTLHNEEWLRSKYLEEKRSSHDIAKLLGCSVPSVMWAMRKFNIPVRDASEMRRGRKSTAVWTDESRERAGARREKGWKEGKYDGVNEAKRGPNYHPDKKECFRRHMRFYRTGITGAEYDRMFAECGGLCAACKQPEKRKRKDGMVKPLAIDHCHAKGVIRGLLCQNCNSALGLIGDNLETLQSLIDYLKLERPLGTTRLHTPSKKKEP